MPDSKSFTAIETKDYTIRLEYSDDFIILHLWDVQKMTKHVFLDMKFRLEDWYKFFITAGYAGVFTAVDPNNLKIKKLLKMLKFKLKGKADGMEVFYYGEV